MDYILSPFERDTLQKIIKTLSHEHAYAQGNGYSDPIALATSASALNALVAMIRVNIKAQDVSARLDSAIQAMTITENSD